MSVGGLLLLFLSAVPSPIRLLESGQTAVPTSCC